MTDLNKRERAILKFIEKQINEKGYPPSVREIGKAVGLSSTATVHTYIAKLKEKGYLSKEDQKGRALKLLKGGKKEVMITSYCIFPTNIQIKDGQAIKPDKKMYEYGGCVYPEGILDSNLSCAFNHNQIEKIVYLGYESEDYQKLSKLLNAGYEQYKQKYEELGIEGIKELAKKAVAQQKLNKQQQQQKQEGTSQE